MGLLTSWAWGQDPDGVQGKLILVFICDNLERGYTVSVQDLCERCEASEEEVKLILDDLQSEGLIRYSVPLQQGSVITVLPQFNLEVTAAVPSRT